ncbi:MULTISPECIES: MFS transporter [unclassified Oceanispirochaeta]|uniref:MFS transporter n=1 Tax=unclassified Oceanispirochaeta TaxID=2635722 RepID=UPI000E09435C|nr:MULTISPECIES: MFS transporter [unclassified Oceanispirochaeta]MBF9014984.1 MFS transporter [Oceanispirochaeta sp. M2]NPD71335.1 MFS transporter [Oceanispirochaeta sp. M1]RDG33301.1 MFS transporter [Oceanispirochaeta sp. M1]
MYGKRDFLKPYRGLKRDIYIIFISKTINAMGAMIFPFMTLLLSSKIGLSGSDTGFYVAMTGLAWGPASLIGGKLCDMYSRKIVLVTAEILAAAAYLICFFMTPGMPMVYMLMAASFFFGMAGPAHDALTADLTTKDQRQGAYSLNYLGFNMGFAFAQVLAGMLFHNHLELMFLIDALTALAGLSLIAFFVHEPGVDRDSQSRIKESGAVPEKSVFAILAAKPLLLFFSLSICAYRFLYSQWPFMIPLHLESLFPGEGAKIFGILGSFNAIIVVVMTPVLTSFFSHRSNVRKVFYAGILFSLGFGLLGFVSFKTAFFISVLIFTLGEILEAISVMPFIMNHTPATHRGRMSSILPIIMGAGFAAGPVIMGSVLDSRGFSFSWFLVAGIGLIATLCMRLIDISDARGDGTQGK